MTDIVASKPLQYKRHIDLTHQRGAHSQQHEFVLYFGDFFVEFVSQEEYSRSLNGRDEAYRTRR
jgi:hypothetical protein